MAKENEFTKILQNSVEDGVLEQKTDLQKRKEEIIAAIQVEEDSVIKNPKTLENLKKELATVEKKMKKEAAEKAVEDGEVVGAGAAEKDVDEDVKEKEEQEEKAQIETKVKKEKNVKEDEEAKDKVAAAKQVYHDAMIALHEKKMQTLQRQKSAGQLISNDEDYEQELNLEAKMYEARNNYLNLGAEDPYTEKRTELIKIEKEAREPIEMELRNRAKRFREIEQKIKEMDKREREINEELMDKDVGDKQVEKLQNELAEMGLKRKDLEIELADIKDNLDNVINTRRERMVQRAGLEKQHIETLTYKDKRNYDYQQSKIATMNNNFDQATKQHYENIKIRIEEREQKIKDINKELKEIPATDFERRLVLLNELDKETNMLEADREAKSELDRGVIPDGQEMAKDAKEKVDSEEYRQKEFDKATDDARDIVEAQKDAIGTAVVENPGLANVEEREREATLKAATVAAVVDNPIKPGPDTIVDDAKQYVVTKCVIKGLEDQVRDPNNPDDAKAMVIENDKIDKANEELQKVQANIEKEAQI